MDDTEFEQFHAEVDRLTKNLHPYEEYETPENIEETFVISNGKGVKYRYIETLDGRMHGAVLSKTDIAKLQTAIEKEKKEYGKRRQSADDIVGRIGTAQSSVGRSRRNSSMSTRGRGSTGNGSVVGRNKSSTEQKGNASSSSANTPSKSNLSIKQDTAVSDRELLANTLMTAVKNEAEMRRLQNYKDKIDEFYKLQDDLADATHDLAVAMRSGDKQAMSSPNFYDSFTT